MKRLIALLLALTLALSVASIAMAEHVYPSELGYGSTELDPDIDPDDYLQPGEEYEIAAWDNNPDDDSYGWDNYSVYSLGQAGVDAGVAVSVASAAGILLDEDTDISVDWSVGGALVESVKFDDDEGILVLTLMENFTIDSLKDLEGTFTFEYYDSTLGDDVEIDFEFYAEVSNHLVIVDGYSNLDDAADDAIEADDNTIYKCSEDEPGYVVFNANNRLFSTTLKMIKNEKAFMFSSEEMIDTVEEQYGYYDADIECYQFGGSPTFTNEAAFSLQADYADQYYVYEWDGYSLTLVDYEWDSINGLYKWATTSPTDYVISDTELVAADELTDGDTTDPDYVEENPDTGASDVVGIAAALSVLSLVAIGAVSLRKRK